MGTAGGEVAERGEALGVDLKHDASPSSPRTRLVDSGDRGRGEVHCDRALAPDVLALVPLRDERRRRSGRGTSGRARRRSARSTRGRRARARPLRETHSRRRGRAPRCAPARRSTFVADTERFGRRTRRATRSRRLADGAGLLGGEAGGVVGDRGRLERAEDGDPDAPVRGSRQAARPRRRRCRVTRTSLRREHEDARAKDRVREVEPHARDRVACDRDRAGCA